MLSRPSDLFKIHAALARAPIVALLGPRQCGKTTLARSLADMGSENYFDLENPLDGARLREPMTALAPLRGLVVLDEIQRTPEIFPVLRVLADRPGQPAQFLVLGSASLDLLRQASESLAGRIEVVSLSGFRMADLPATDGDRHWLRGGFPRAYLAKNDPDALDWCKQFVRTFLERDVPQFGIRVPTPTLHRFWMMMAHYHGQTWNGAEAAAAMGVGQKAARHYLELLDELLMLRILPPFHENLAKRQVKSPKLYFRDSGVLHALMGIGGMKDLLLHPRHGASWEGYALEEVLKACQPDAQYFWGTHQGAELDLLMFRGERRVGVEFKRSDAPQLTPSMRIAQQDLKLDRLVVLYPGAKTFPLAQGITAMPLASLRQESASSLIWS